MSNAYPQNDTSPTGGLPVNINNNTDNINFMFNFAIDSTLDLKEIADSLETLILNGKNPNLGDQIHEDLSKVLNYKRIKNIFTIENKKNNKWFFINRSIYLNFDDKNVEIDLNKYKFISSLIEELKRINYENNNSLYEISYHENYELYKYYKTYNLEYCSNLQVEVDLVPESLAFEIPEELFVTDIIFPEFYKNVMKLANTYDEYLSSMASENSYIYYFNEIENILYLPLIMLNVSMSIVAIKRNFNFNWSELKINHLAHESAKKIIKTKESNYYELSSKGIHIFDLVSKLHSSVWGK